MGRADELFVVAIVVVERAAEVSGVGAAAVLLRSSTVAVGKVTGRREAGALRCTRVWRVLFGQRGEALARAMGDGGVVREVSDGRVGRCFCRLLVSRLLVHVGIAVIVLLFSLLLPHRLIVGWRRVGLAVTVIIFIVVVVIVPWGPAGTPHHCAR